MIDENIRQLQKKEMDILNAFISVCEKNKLKYYAVGGTLLGAVRHKGFIPWDDDMDVAMPRKDYEKFLHIFYKDLPENIKVLHYTNGENVYFYPMKLQNTDVKVTEQRLEETDSISYLSIDVFPIDGYPNKRSKQALYKLKYYYYKMLIGFCNVNILRKNVDRPFYERVIIKFAKLFRLNRILKLKKQQDKFDKLLKSTMGEECKLVGDISGAYGFREFVPVSYFGKGTKLDFEDIKINCPCKYDKYLKRIYGDYMQLPPEDKRVAGHLKIVE
ncbi:MAG: LicD family protein [Lachnospiraceae bacterium]|nr:LicD family protein [Lachnospiraceae bacterium]